MCVVLHVTLAREVRLDLRLVRQQCHVLSVTPYEVYTHFRNFRKSSSSLESKQGSNSTISPKENGLLCQFILSNSGICALENNSFVIQQRKERQIYF